MTPYDDNLFEIYQQALDLASKFEVNFVALARCLRYLKDHNDNLYKGLCAERGLDPRKAYYLVKMASRIHNLEIPDNELIELGWTKAAEISNHLTKSNGQDLVDLAKAHSVRDLKIILRGGTPVKGTRCVLLYLEPQQYEIFANALLKNGATTSATGLTGKETALMAILEKAEET